MKKKILFGAVIAAMALIVGLTGCPKAIGDVKFNSAFGSGDGTKTYKVKQTNEKKTNIRGIQPTGVLNRAQGTCVIQMNNQSNKTDDGVCGFITCYTKNKSPAGQEKLPNDGTYNFLVVGVRCQFGQPKYYISYYCNISEDTISTENFGAGTNTKATIDPDCYDPYEIELVKYTNLTKVAIEDGKLTVAIKFVGNSNGTIDVELLKDVETNTQAATTSGGTRIAYYQVKPSEIGDKDQSGEGEGLEKGKLSVYANIYAEQTLDARWDIYDVSWKENSIFSAEEASYYYGDVIFTEL